MRSRIALRVSSGLLAFVALVTFFALAAPNLAGADPLESGFAAPPDSAKPHTWWHWMNGNITQEGITRDIEEMKRVGLGGAMIFNVDCGIPEGPVAFMSDEWRRLVKHAITEADRVGLDLCLHNCAGWSSSGGPWVTPELGMQKVVWSEVTVDGPKHFEDQLPAPEKKLDCYRDIAVLAFPAPANNTVRLDHWSGKAGFERQDNPAADTRASVPQGSTLASKQSIDLTAQMDKNGRLTWDAPQGKWLVMRFGYTPIGIHNHPAPKAGDGLECDKLSADAAEAFWKAALDPILSDIGPLAGKSLTHTLIDSYEVGAQNWTAKFREEFKTRRGYDPVPYLPAMSGRIIDTVEVTERFLWDLRLTIADLFADNYFGKFAELGRQHNIKLATEPYGDGNFDDMRSGGRADLPMTEFWVGQGPDPSGPKLAASIAHTYGDTVVGAESFTAAPERGKWTTDPFATKALGDAMYCGGVNRFIFHRYAMQPWLDKYPGMTMGPWGMHFERTLTWWNQSPAWLNYLARCQYLLQQGLFVADVCYFAGEGSPHSLQGRDALQPVLPFGYDYDGCEADVLFKRMSVKDGKLVLPDGMSYRALVLPPTGMMTPALLRRVTELVQDGAIVVGPKPTRSPSLADYPKCDDDVKKLADALWGDCDGKAVTSHVFGKGKIVWGKSMGALMTSLDAEPDFAFTSESDGFKPAWIHRRTNDADIYFVSNGQRRSVSLECAFRVTGKQPELWRADTGQMDPAPVYSEKDGRTVVPLRLDPCGSIFVVFRRAPISADHVVAARWNGKSLFQPKPGAPSTLEIRSARYGVLKEEAPSVKNVTEKVAAMVKDGALTVVAGNSLDGDPAPNKYKTMRVDYTYAGKRAIKEVKENETLTLPDGAVQPGAALTIHKALYGVLPPDGPEGQPVNRTVDITSKLQALVKDGRISTAVGNALAGSDPASLVPKQFEVDYVLNGAAKTVVMNENETLELPESDFQASSVAELTVTGPSKVTLCAFEPGAYEFDTRSGKTVKADVAPSDALIPIAGSWKVQFQPNRKAPATATFDKLISWTDSPDPGIKYFSGTATYTKVLDIPGEQLSKDKSIYLDLGRLSNLAQVRVNDHDFGVLWKPPYRVEVTGVLKPGANSIEIAVTNTWANRLIGDEQYPDDCQWNGDGSLKAWPDWFLKGAQRPSADRVTFTTWKHYTKDAPLFESGLLGPVELRAATIKEVTW